MPAEQYRRAPYRPFTAYMPRNLKEGDNFFDPINEAIDLEWGGTRTDERFNSYYDYFFSGEDVKVYIDGLFDEKDEMDIASMAFVVKQEKQPLYGFWSYNYDAMMLGTRLITGELSIYSRYPRRMTDLLEQAAKVRMESSSSNPSSAVRSTLGSSTDQARKDDEINIQKYWLNSELDRVTSDPMSRTLIEGQGAGHNIFSAHPPFNLIIFYGVEEDAVTNNKIVTYDSANSINRQLNSDRILSTDYNERKTLTDLSSSSPMKLVLQNINLMSMTTSYTSGGQPLVENYQFVARDMYFTDARVGDNAVTGQKVTVPDETEKEYTTQNVTTQTVTSGVTFNNGEYTA
jgi:hypothetical protein